MIPSRLFRLLMPAALAVGALVFAQRRGVEGPEHAVLPIVFQNVAKFAGIDFVLKNSASENKYQIETMPAGVAVLDYNNDGFEDIYFVNGANIPGLTKTDASYWNRLYRNNGDGTFTDVTAKAGVAGDGYGMAVAVGDYDNDGWDDLFVAGVNRNTLYRNNRDGTFSDVTQKAGLAAGPSKPWSISAGWFDYDNDGWLDLFVVNYCKWAPGQDPYCGDNKPGHRTYCDPRLYQGYRTPYTEITGMALLPMFRLRRGSAPTLAKGWRWPSRTTMATGVSTHSSPTIPSAIFCFTTTEMADSPK